MNVQQFSLWPHHSREDRNPEAKMNVIACFLDPRLSIRCRGSIASVVRGDDVFLWKIAINEDY